MTGRLEGKIAIITGAARGTGAATARLFVEEGAQVCLADVLDDAGQAEALELGDAAMFQHMDVRSEGDWKRAVEATRERFGPVNVLVNNAAILDVGPIAELDVEKARDILDVNLIGPMIGTSAVLGDMQEAGGGAIVNIGSIDAMEGMGWVAPYSASKWGLRGFTKSAALELGQLGIRVNLVCPAGGSPELTQGFISNIQQRRDAGETIELRGFEGGVLGEREATPRDIANVVLFLASDDAGFCHGAEYMVDGGHTAGHIWFATKSDAKES
ncbi:MAG: SDR family oxidoreductase [Myxococcota bacterium]|jgi:3alpha(or 20beta)-hydroxysteroid dehydrogenase